MLCGRVKKHLLSLRDLIARETSSGKALENGRTARVAHVLIYTFLKAKEGVYVPGIGLKDICNIDKSPICLRGAGTPTHLLPIYKISILITVTFCSCVFLQCFLGMELQTSILARVSPG